MNTYQFYRADLNDLNSYRISHRLHTDRTVKLSSIYYFYLIKKIYNQAE